VDAVIDAVSGSGDEFGAVVGLVKKGGRAASTRGAAQGDEIDGVTTTNANGNPAHLAALAQLVADGEVRVAVSRTYRLDDAAAALRDLGELHTLGKLVISIV
jgi:NADPH:quinone reductase-like Zn-dependent oxidoreductase